MPRLSLSDDPFASVAEKAGHSRKAFPVVLLLLLPVLGLAGIVFVPKPRLPFGSPSRAAECDGMPDRCAIIANHHREIERAHCEVLYWTRRTTGSGVVTAADQAELAAWERCEKNRRVLLARMSRN